jgi:hypothetical protein
MAAVIRRGPDRGGIESENVGAGRRNVWEHLLKYSLLNQGGDVPCGAHDQAQAPDAPVSHHIAAVPDHAAPDVYVLLLLFAEMPQ